MIKIFINYYPKRFALIKEKLISRNEFDKNKINKIGEIIVEENAIHQTLIEPNTLLIRGSIEKIYFLKTK